MKIWFIRNNNESLGPYTIEELGKLPVAKDDYVWKEGLSDWVRAETVPELDPLFASAPPPFSAQIDFSSGNSSSRSRSTDPYSYFSAGAKQGRFSLRRFLWMGIILVLSFVTYFIYANNQTGLVSAATTLSNRSQELLKAELAQKERDHSTDYLSYNAKKLRENLIGEKVIEGVIISKAVHTSFKDIVLQVDFLSKTGSILATRKFTIYEIIAPGQAIHFKQKAFLPKDVIDMQITIVGAEAFN